MGLPCSIQFSGSCSSTRRSSFSRATWRGVCRGRSCWRFWSPPAWRVAALLTYRNTGGDQPLRDRIVPMALADRRRSRCWSSACSGPTLILRASVPQQNFVARAGRRLAQHDDRRHRRPAAQRIRPGAVRRRPNAKLLEALSQRFVLRFFRFASSVDRAAVGDEPEVRRHLDPARARRSSARATNCRACRSPAS